MTLPSLLYAYAIAELSELAERPANVVGRVVGIDAAPVTLVRDAEGAQRSAMGVLASEVSAATYAPGEVEARVGELAWLGPRAEAHDRVVTAAADVAPVIPLPIFSLFRDEAALRTMLTARREELVRLFARVRDAREYTVRVYRDDAKLGAALADLSPHIQTLERDAARASPGQRYLLQRKLEEARRSELRRVSGEVARDTFRALAAIARAAVREPLPPAITGAEARAAATTQPAILNASFLVDDGALDDFRLRLSEVIVLRAPAGFRVDFTGPWPAYHFAREADDDADGVIEAGADGESADG